MPAEYIFIFIHLSWGPGEAQNTCTKNNLFVRLAPF